MRHISSPPAPDAWEAAYLRFETPEKEIRKFVRRLHGLGAAGWSREARIVELFCGRGNGLRALGQLGFSRVEGIDLSPALVARYEGPGKLLVGDCRQLPFEDRSKDILIVQGGLHHLPTLPNDLEATLQEAKRVLAPGGLFCAVEPWLTPFLRLAHAVCANSVARKFSAKIDALATMIQHERRTYEQWLGQPRSIQEFLDRFFPPQMISVRWGKIHYVGRKD